ncbi:MAG TPA: proline dehydrogenase family protein, partial [Methylomirabilota bacterium]|nr:proline dehydrogenase family protein [Methylomirabilota bacterium]
MPPATLNREKTAAEAAALENSIRQYGERIFQLMDAADAPSLFSRKGFYGTLMEWAMRDEHFKTQLFRFVDVLPTLTSSGEVARHLKEYLGDADLSPALRVGLKAAGGMSWLFGAGVKAQVTGMARQFMLGDDEKEIVATLRKLNDQGIAFTVDILGEAVVSEKEADDYAQRYLDLMELLGGQIGKWRSVCKSNEGPRGALPALNVSVKVSALYSQIQPADPERAVERISARLRPILRRAKELGAFVNFDMESYALKDVTLRLFKAIFSEPEFAVAPECGLALQAYLKDCENDLRDIIGWAEGRKRRLTIRLVKGAYWDYETVIAGQR